MTGNIDGHSGLDQCPGFDQCPLSHIHIITMPIKLLIIKIWPLFFFAHVFIFQYTFTNLLHDYTKINGQ